MKLAEKFCTAHVVGSGRSIAEIRNALDDLCVDSEEHGGCTDWKMRDGSVVRQNEEDLFFSLPENCFGGVVG